MRTTVSNFYRINIKHKNTSLYVSLNKQQAYTDILTYTFNNKRGTLINSGGMSQSRGIRSLITPLLHRKRFSHCVALYNLELGILCTSVYCVTSLYTRLHLDGVKG